MFNWQFVELDSMVLDIARDYFGLKEDTRLKVIHCVLYVFLSHCGILPILSGVWNRQRMSYHVVF